MSRFKNLTEKKKILLGVGTVLVVIVLLGVVKFIKIRSAIAQNAAFAPPPEAVTSLVVKNLSWQRSLSAVGTLIASQGVTLAAEEPGKVVKIGFESGDKVEAGRVLVELDTSVESANLKGAEATLKRAKEELERTKLLKSKSIASQSDLDRANADASAAEAQVESLKAVIELKKVVAPFNGRTGIRMVNVGEYLSAGESVVPLHVLDPLFLNFTLAQREAALVQIGNEVVLKVSGMEDRVVKGKVHAINPQLDEKTRTLQVQATIPNTDESLKPGMFAAVEVILPQVDSVIAIPTSSISYAPYGDMVWVIEAMKAADGADYKGVRQQVVKLGAKRGDQVAVLSGLKEGEEIVTSGVFKLRPGGAIAVNNDFAPTNDPNPQPEQS